MKLQDLKKCEQFEVIEQGEKGHPQKVWGKGKVWEAHEIIGHEIHAQYPEGYYELWYRPSLHTVNLSHAQHRARNWFFYEL